MDTRIWARLDGARVVELSPAYDADLVPGTDIPDLWTDDVTGVPGIAPGWIKGADGIFAAFTEPPPTVAELVAYANMKQWQIATGGFTTTLGGQSLTFSTDPTSMALTAGKTLRLAQANPPATINWQLGSGFVTITAADFFTVASEIADFVQGTFDHLKAALDGIAGGTIATLAQVDSALAG